MTYEIVLDEPVYTAGPMTGLPERNYPAFRRMQARLEARGFTQIENPCAPDDHPDDPHPWDWYMRRAIAQVVRCRTILLLPGWQNSQGAKLEHMIAKALGMPIYYIEEEYVDHLPFVPRRPAP